MSLGNSQNLKADGLSLILALASPKYGCIVTSITRACQISFRVCSTLTRRTAAVEGLRRHPASRGSVINVNGQVAGVLVGSSSSYRPAPDKTVGLFLSQVERCFSSIQTTICPTKQ